MIKAENMNVKAENIVNGELDFVTKMVRFVVRDDEYTAKKNSMSQTITNLATAHAGINPMDLSEKQVREALGDDAPKFLKDREELKSIKADRDSCGATRAEYDELSEFDKRCITMLAHGIRKSIVLDKSILENVDLKKPVTDYINGGKIKKLKDTLKPVLNRVFPQIEDDGGKFYGIKFGDINNSDARQFMGFFTGVAMKDKNGNFDWADKSENEAIQLNAITTLASVLLSRGDYKVIIPEIETEEDAVEEEVVAETEKAMAVAKKEMVA